MTETAAFRQALGDFATGITVLTTADRQGTPYGVTASSFNSVSLDPPLVLWSLANNSGSMAAFAGADRFAVHVLGADQEALSNRFASRGADKFAGIGWDRGESGVPLLPDCAARFLCRTVHRYEGGDHTIFVGEVQEFTRCAKAPLLFHGGRYAEARQRVAGARECAGVDLQSGVMNTDFFLYLLPAAYFHATAAVRTMLATFSLSIAQSLSLTLIHQNGAMPQGELAQRLAHTGHAPSETEIAGMEARGWLRRDALTGACSLTDAGRSLYLDVLTRMKAHEEWMLSHFASHEIAEIKQQLSRLVSITSQGAPAPWREARH